MKEINVVKQSRRAFLRAAGTVTAGCALGALPWALHAAEGASKGLRIGVIGSGNVGSTIGTLWGKAGHQVMFSSLDIEHDRKLAASIGSGARAGTPKEAAAFGEVLFFAVPYTALPALGRDLATEIKGKIVLDASNPIPRRDGDMAVAALAKGTGVASPEFLPGARIVRAFNAIGYARMGEASKNPGKVGMPIAGDDPKAIEIASALIKEIGYEPVMVGSLATMGKYLIPGTPLGGEHTPAEIRQIASTLK